MVRPQLPVRLLLGPQRPTKNLAEAVEAAGVELRSFAVISAGWQEAENDIDDVAEIVGLPLRDLCLYHRAEELFEADARLAEAYRARQDALKEQQRLYRLRLKQLAIAARQTLRATGDADMLAAEQRHAIAQLRALDRHHLHRTDRVHRRFDDAFNADTMPLIGRHHREIADILDDTDALLITGGNIVVLANRMRLFGLADLIGDRHIVAWSAGAMALADRIVLFHDRMPQGKRDPEVLGAGCGILPGFVILPDSTYRLREHERSRISLMSRRFSPDTCVALDSGSSLEIRGKHLANVHAVRKLGNNGKLKRLRAA